jgi:hypothetical protein
MQLKTAALASAIVAIATAIETHGGYQFESRFAADVAPETSDIKDPYETEAAMQAYAHLQDRITATGLALHCPVGTSYPTPADLYKLKDCIAADNKDNFFTLLAQDIEQSNDFWAKVVEESTADRTQWVPARVVSDIPDYPQRSLLPRRLQPLHSILFSFSFPFLLSFNIDLVSNSHCAVHQMLLWR